MKYGYRTKYKHIVTRVNLNFIYPDFFRHIWVKKSCKNVTCLSSRDLFFCILYLLEYLRDEFWWWKWDVMRAICSRNISDCSHFLILVSIRTALLTNLKFGEGWSQPSNETQNLVDRSWRPKNIIQYYYHAIWKWYIYTYICIKNVFEQYLYQYNESNIIFTHLSICFRMF